MNYYVSKVVDGPFENAVARVTEGLAKEGFGVLTEIDVQATLKKKLDVDFRPYKILGACNPNFAYQALRAEDKIGLMLPCNVVVQERDEQTCEVAVINPMQQMQPVNNPKIQDVAEKVQQALKGVIEGL
jgi:uncharacterized protein (DUF302 family)